MPLKSLKIIIKFIFRINFLLYRLSRYFISKNTLHKLKIILINLLDTYRSYSKHFDHHSIVVYFSRIIKKLTGGKHIYDNEEKDKF